MKKYQIIYADPPWKYRSKMKGSRGQYSLSRHYLSLTTKKICELPIKDISDKNAILFIWTTDAHVPDCLQVIKAWGFTYKTIGFIWNKKENTGTQVCYCGMWTCKSSEICLLATKGKIKKKRNNIRQLVEAQRTKHSRKPSEIRKRIVDLMGDLPRVELFTRKEDLLFDADSFEGWDVWGNEVESDIEIYIPAIKGKS